MHVNCKHVTMKYVCSDEGKEGVEGKEKYIFSEIQLFQSKRNSFDEILSLVASVIKKKDTKMLRADFYFFLRHFNLTSSRNMPNHADWLLR